MATWNVSTDTQTITVEAANWLGALSAALPKLGLSQGSLGRLVCSILDGGGAEATDPVAGAKLRIVPATAGASSAPAPVDASTDVLASDHLATATAAAPAPATPTAWVQKMPDIERMEALFDRCADISSATDVRGACERALNVLTDLVPTESGAVLLATRSREHLRFASASGPAAAQVLDTTIPADAGVAGFSYEFIMGVVIDDARKDERHYSNVDKQTGYKTKGVLSVPIRTPDGASYGCMQLLNPPTAFDGKDLDVAETVSNALGAWLQTAML